MTADVSMVIVGLSTFHNISKADGEYIQMGKAYALCLRPPGLGVGEGDAWFGSAMVSYADC